MTTQAVEFTVGKVERVNGRGALVGLAIVEMDVAGVVFTLQGVQIVQMPDGRLNCKSPVWRHPASGKWLPGVVLPPDLAKALADEVLEMWTAQA
jgi:hypothetical protein